MDRPALLRLPEKADRHPTDAWSSDPPSQLCRLKGAGVSPADEGNMVRPRVSVVLPTFKRDHVVGITIESILAQTFRDYELLICDDCSPDATSVVCRRFEELDSRVSYERNERNLGMPRNLLTGLSRARGDYVAILHDGDLYEPMLLERWVDALDACPSAGFVFNAYRVVDAQGAEIALYREPLGECQPGRILIEHIYLRRWRFDSPVWGTTMFRRTAYDAAGALDARFGFFADVDLWLRLAESFAVAYVAEPLIGLPNREVLPRLFQLGSWEEQRTVERIFLEARLRLFRGRPFRLGLELARHGGHVVASRLWRYALSCRRWPTALAARARIYRGGSTSRQK